MPQPYNSFPSSTKLVRTLGYEESRHNPLQFLLPGEVKAAEIFAMVSRDPTAGQTYPPGPVRKWSALRSGSFNTRFHEATGFSLSYKHRKSLEENAAWRHYVRMLLEESKDVVMQKLKNDALEAYDTYKWSREAARLEGDYKEARLAAADHLDRIGATEKPQPQQQVQVIVLRGRTFEEGNLMKELPETTADEAEIVIE